MLMMLFPFVRWALPKCRDHRGTAVAVMGAALSSRTMKRMASAMAMAIGLCTSDVGPDAMAICASDAHEAVPVLTRRELLSQLELERLQPCL